MKISWFADDVILCVENLKISKKNLLELTKQFSKVAENKINTEKSVVFIYTNNNKKKLKEELGKYFNL